MTKWLLPWSFAAVSALWLTVAPRAHARPGDLLGHLPFETVAPQGIARDLDGTFWVTDLLGGQIHQYSTDLTERHEALESPFGNNTWVTGIAVNTRGGPVGEDGEPEGTLLIVVVDAGPIVEIDRKGAVLRVIPIALDPPVNAFSGPTVRGLAFNHWGDNGRGSVYLVESLGTVIYEISLSGNVIRSFVHPGDPDGFPGMGRSAPAAAGIDLIFDGEDLAGIYLTGTRWGEVRIERVDPDGGYDGISIPLTEAGGSVAGILRTTIADPETGEQVDAFVCVVDSNARFAILEGGEPVFRELVDFRCEESGRTARLFWTATQEYERIEILQDSHILEVLPGNRDSWQGDVDIDGVYEFSVRVVDGDDSMEPPPCTIVIGPGQVLDVERFDVNIPVDVAWDGEDALFVSDALEFDVNGFPEHRIHVSDLAFDPLGTVFLAAPTVAPGDAITGLAYDPAAGRLFVYNNTQHKVAIVDDSGGHLGEFRALIPDLDDDPKEEDFGSVIGMAYDAAGDGGQGSLWVVEIRRDFIYELDLDGALLRKIRHPYADLERIPEECPFGSYSGGVSMVAGKPFDGNEAPRLYLTGGGVRDFGQRYIFQLDIATGKVVPGTEITTAGIARDATDGNFGIVHLPPLDDQPPRIVAVPQIRPGALVVVDATVPPVPAPTFLTCVQRGLPNDVTIRFNNNGSYTEVEVRRDNAVVKMLPGDAERFVDENVPVGPRAYAVRGLRDAQLSGEDRCQLQVGPGAILQHEFTCPAAGVCQITRDPTDSSFYVAVNQPGRERTLYVFDGSLDFVAERETVVERPWQIATLGARVAPDDTRQLYLLTWLQPAPLGRAGMEDFFLIVEDIVTREKIDEILIDPPRPNNGFVTFPTGLSWDENSDTFFYLERNSKRIVRMAPNGETIDDFDHPDPPFQNFVSNLGLAVVPSRDSLLLTTSGRKDKQVTRVIEVAFEGATKGKLSGYSFSLGELSGGVRGITMLGRELVAVGGGSNIYRLKGLPGAPAPFIRGDFDENGEVNITDPIAILGLLFDPEETDLPLCQDAADADDSGNVSLTDAIVVLNHLFLEGPPLSEPFPDAGDDFTHDGLPCE